MERRDWEESERRDCREGGGEEGRESSSFSAMERTKGSEREARMGARVLGLGLGLGFGVVVFLLFVLGFEGELMSLGVWLGMEFEGIVLGRAMKDVVVLERQSSTKIDNHSRLTSCSSPSYKIKLIKTNLKNKKH